MYQDWQIWGRVSGRKTERKSSTQYTGYGLSSGGFILGADKPFLPWIHGGFAISVDQTSIDFGQPASGDQQSILMGFYAGTIEERLFGDISLSFGLYENSAERQVSTTNYSSAVMQDFKGNTFQFHAGGGYLFNAYNWFLGPVLGIDFIRINTDGFQENSGGFLDMRIEDIAQETTTSIFGLKVLKHFSSETFSLENSFEIAWLHLLSGEETAMEASFKDYPSSTFRVSSVGVPVDVLNTGVGLTAHFGDQVSAYCELVGNLGEDFTDYHISLGFEWAF